MKDEKFDQWCIVEVMGHQRLAGRVTEHVIAGKGFIRVDVPSINDKQGYTKLIGPDSIYCMTPVNEETAKLAVANGQSQEPIDEWSAREMLGLTHQTQSLDLDDDELF